MSRVVIKTGVQFSVIAPAGYKILDALRSIAAFSDVDLVITSGTDGEHSGPMDPHKLGEAYDVRSKNLTDAQKAYVLDGLEMALGKERFFFFLESPGSLNEHFHIQRRKHTRFTVEDLLAWRDPTRPVTT